MSSRSEIRDILGALRSGWFEDGVQIFEEELAKLLVPGEDYSKLLAEELPTQSLLAQASIVEAFAMAKHIEALPYAVALLDVANDHTRFVAGVAAALLNDSRGIAAIRRLIAQPDTDMSRYHIIDGLEDAVSHGPNAELRELLREAKTAFGYT